MAIGWVTTICNIWNIRGYLTGLSAHSKMIWFIFQVFVWTSRLTIRLTFKSVVGYKKARWERKLSPCNDSYLESHCDLLYLSNIGILNYRLWPQLKHYCKELNDYSPDFPEKSKILNKNRKWHLIFSYHFPCPFTCILQYIYSVSMESNLKRLQSASFNHKTPDNSIP